MVGGKASEKTERGLGVELHWTTLPTLDPGNKGLLYGGAR